MTGMFKNLTHLWSPSRSDIQALSLKALEDEALCAPVVLTWTPDEGSAPLRSQALALALIPTLRRWFPVGGLLDVPFSEMKPGNSFTAAHLPIAPYWGQDGVVRDGAHRATVRVVRSLERGLRHRGNRGVLRWAPAEMGAVSGFGNFYLTEKNRVPVAQRDWKLRFVDTGAP